MDYSLRETTDIHQWIKKVQEQSENNAERLAVETRTSSILKKAEKEKLEDEIEYLKQKYLGHSSSSSSSSPSSSRTRDENKTKQYSSLSPSLSSSPPHHSHLSNSPRSSKYNFNNNNNNNVPIQRQNNNRTAHNETKENSTTRTNNKKPQLEVLKSKYTKFGSKAPDLEDYAFYGVDKNIVERQIAKNERDMDLIDFDHGPPESEWRRKFPNEKKQENTSPRRKSSVGRDIVTETRNKRQEEKHKIEKEIHKKEKEKTPRKDDPDTELSLVANFDPLAIEAHSLLHNWIDANKLDVDNNADEEEPAPLSRWQKLKAEIHDLEGPSMLLKQPPDPRSVSHHTASSKRKIIPEPPKQEEKKVVKVPVAFDPRPKMEARHERVHQMQKQRAESGKEVQRKRQEMVEAQTRAREIEEEKRRVEKQVQDRQAKAIEDEMLFIKLKREEETALIKEEERKILEAHKMEVQRKLKEDRAQLELEEARRIEEIRKEEEEKRKRLKEEQNTKLAKSHADKKILQKCLSTWFLHVRELKLKLEKFKVVWEWKKVNQTFKVWRRFAQNSKAEREANEYAIRAKTEQRNLDRAVHFRERRVLLRSFLIWRARAKLKGEQTKLQEQHELRKQQMAQFLQKVKQSPSPNLETASPKQETPPPTKISNSGIPAKGKIGPAGNNKASPTRPKLQEQASPNLVKSGPSNRRVSPSPRSRQIPVPNADSGQSTPPNKGKKPDEQLVEKSDKSYTPPSRAYLEMESRAEDRKNRRKELEQKYLDAQKKKEDKKKEEEDKERLRIEAEKQAKLEQKRLAKQKEAANQRRKEIEEKSEKMAIQNNEKRLLKFYCWLPWRKYVNLQNAKLQQAAAHCEKILQIKVLRVWRETTQQIIEDKLQFADEFYEDNLQLRLLNSWVEALRRSRTKVQKAEVFCNLQIQKRQFVVWYQKAKIAMDKRAAEDLRKELEMEKYYSLSIRKKMWRAWRRYVIITKDEIKSEKRKDDMRQKAHEWLLQHRQAKSTEEK